MEKQLQQAPLSYWIEDLAGEKRVLKVRGAGKKLKISAVTQAVGGLLSKMYTLWECLLATILVVKSTTKFPQRLVASKAKARPWMKQEMAYISVRGKICPK